MSYKKDMSKYEHLEGWERCGFGEQLDKWAEKYGERTAVTDSEDEISYMELKQKADCLAAAFLRKGILKGDKVLVQLPNRISFVIVFFALSKIGAVPIMMLPAHREAELEGIIELAKPAAYIVVEKYLGFSYVPMANAMKEKYSCIRHIFVDSESGDISGMIAETCGENGAFPAVDGYETAVLLLSGGTTGVPKLIPRTHTDYMYNARMSAKRCRLDSSDVYLASLPVAHNFPLCCPGLLGTLDVGGKVVLASATSPDDILDAITEEGVTITALVPAMVTVCMEMLEWDENYDISSLRILQVGGAMLEDSLADKIIEEWPCKLMQVFGTAEGLLSFTSPEDEGSLIARCQGTPVSPADEVKIVDEEDKAVPEGVLGNYYPEARIRLMVIIWRRKRIKRALRRTDFTGRAIKLCGRKTEGYVWAGGSKSRLTAPEKRSCLQRLKLTFAGIRKSKRQPLSAFRMKPLETGYVHSL